ncbi:hypothetical protein SAMN02910356_01136 [Selenomonas sp. GACV-9]|uniref:flagellar protein FliT n=1 Tax=Selenomonas sp. GACV-9 TaxID=3158782 RepID=UPI0008F29AF4|nr:hypothetical protein SAMN02910356_01136 [Selenomonas ruminantium]
MSADTPLEQAKANWELYYTLSEELLKFINKQDIDEFIELVNQREELVKRMKALPETETYRQTAECQALIEKIKPNDMQIIYKAKSWLNKSKRQNATVHAYDLQSINTVGNILNRKY